ncbi:uncharacterized protein [Littorina saxatilis]|uniref:uncharacterized protein n=1 Tax=Littorina saxatilis TaxID=31220 RepID=UPI0038B49365
MTEEAEREANSPIALIKETTCVERNDGPVTLRLLDSALWQAFCQEGTEMIITKAGRRMFPFVMVTVEGLSPTLLYSFHLALVPYDSRQYKFCQRRWVSVSDTAPGPTPNPEQSYTHPASPNRGSFWCQEMISFAKLKITNNKHSQGDIVLQSMRKYMAQITVREDLGDTEYVFVLPETTFVAVTQYQNEAVTRMKIAHNPFANGFKYAHVTGSEDGKKIYPRPDALRSPESRTNKHSLSGSKTGAKIARAKATVTPQSLVLSTISFAENVQPTDLTSSRPPQPSQYLVPGGETVGLCVPQQENPDSGLSGDVAMPASPYAFESDENETESDFSKSLEVDVEKYSLDAVEDPVEGAVDYSGGARTFSGGISKCSDRIDNHSPIRSIRRQSSASNEFDDEGEEKGEEDSGQFDATDSDCRQTDLTCRLPTTVTDAVNSPTEPGSLGENIIRNEENLSSPTCFSTGVHTVIQVSVKAPSAEKSTITNKVETFKLPLPKKSSGGKKNAKKSSSTPSDADLHWYKNALRQANQRQQECVIKTDRGVQLKLHDTHIWSSFAACGSKMVLSHDGRNMFPVVSISLRGLDPGRLYSVWLHVTSADDVTREQGAWVQGVPAQRPGPSVRPYMHPCSPMRGLAWMKVKVAFSELKLTSDMASEDASCLSLSAGKRYLVQLVVREEEEATPGNDGSSGDLLFFPLPEVTFVANFDSNDVKSSLPLIPAAPRVHEYRKRPIGNSNSALQEDPEEAEEILQQSLAKVSRSDNVQNLWLKPPAIVPRPVDLSAIIPRAPDLNPFISRPADIAQRMNPVYCFPPVSSLQPAHVGLLANRMPVAPPLQTVTPFPFQPQLFPQLRSPMHSAFGMTLPPFSPFPYVYYPYTVPPLAATAANISDVSKGLDLSLKSVGTPR